MLAREIAARVLSFAGLQSRIQAMKYWNGLLVVNYHRVGDGETTPFDFDVLSASEEEFDAQIVFYKAHFDIVGVADLPLIRNARGRYLQITCDDGYRDNHDVMFPILHRHGATCTFFVATGYIDKPVVPWWDELAWMVRGSARTYLPRADWLPQPIELGDGPSRILASRYLNALYTKTPLAEREAFLDQLGEATGNGRCGPAEASELWMTWDMIREMHRGGMSFGAHTVNHIELSRLPLEVQEAEIRGSRRRLEEELGTPITSFSYPFGRTTSFNDDTRESLRRSGIQYAYSYYGGYQKPGEWDAHDLRRVHIETDVSHHLLIAMATAPQFFGRPRHEPLLNFGPLRRKLAGRISNLR